MYLSVLEHDGLANADWMADEFHWDVEEIRELFDAADITQKKSSKSGISCQHP